MPPRRSHHKSRHGCITCKRRRVKCDESGPPCANCKSRDTECQYTVISLPSSSPSKGTTPSSAPASSDRSSPSSSVGRTSPTELQLLHRWSTVTYLSVGTEIADDWTIWQRTVPEVAMNYDCLMHTIFAITAFEMAHSIPGDAIRWTNKALEYQGLAFRNFRDHLQDMTEDYHDAMLYCSILLMVLALASATSSVLVQESTIDHTISHHELVRGTSLVMLKKPDCYHTHPLWQKVPPFLELEKNVLAPDKDAVLHNLTELNESRAANESQNKAYIGCQTAIAWLKYLYETCMDMKLRTFSLAWMTCAGADYTAAVKERDHVALLALMCWGVLMAPLGDDFWYGKGFGQSVVSEVANALKDEPRAAYIIAWAELQSHSITNKQISPGDSALGMLD